MSSSFIYKVFRLFRERPSHAWSFARCYLMFYLTALMRNVFPHNGVSFGANVKLQRLSSLMAEAPDATIQIGDDSILYEDATLEAYGNGNISLGSNCIIGATKIFSRHAVRIGDRVITSWNVYIQDYDPHPLEADLRAEQVLRMSQGFLSRSPLKPISKRLHEWGFPGAPISIGNDVWIGTNVAIMKGAQIGDGCIVGAGAVVLKGNYPDHSLIAGNPAKVVKSIANLSRKEQEFCP